MMDLLRTFSTLTLMAGAVLTLLPEGSLRKTAILVLGLMITMCWTEGLFALLPSADGQFPTGSLLAPTAITLSGIQAQSADFLARHRSAEVTDQP